MSGVRITGLGVLDGKLSKLESATNTQDLLDTMGAFMLHRIRQRFLNQEAPSGIRWPESKAAKKRKASGRDGGTLFDTGNLFHSITLGRVGTSGRSIFTTVDYAEKHNEGLEGAERREFLGFSVEDETSLSKFIDERIRSLL